MKRFVWGFGCLWLALLVVACTGDQAGEETPLTGPALVMFYSDN